MLTKNTSRNTNALTVVEDVGVRPVKIINNDVRVFPELWLSVHVVGNDDFEQAMFAQMFLKARCWKAKSLEEADLVIFTGGDDVNPLLYGEECHLKTFFDEKRDKEEMEAYAKCYALGIPMFGVCRGMQFLHVMNGGKLFQHVDNHQGDHSMFCVHEKRQLERVSSVHHQMCIDNTKGGMELLGFCGRSRERHYNDTVMETKIHKDVEALFYRDTCCLGVQGHPEYAGYDEFLQWTLERIDEYVNLNTDLELDKDSGCRRIKQDILKQRTLQVFKSLS